MLVCNISMRPPRRAVAADIAETATALDASTTGFVVFATLVDDPASVADLVDAYLGEIMLEPASAIETISCGAAYDGSMVEAATASSVEDAGLAAALATFDGTASNVTLSNGNLTATHSNNTSTAGARSTALKSSGKYYFEITVGQHTNSSSVRDAAGILLSTGGYGDMTSTATNCSMVMYWSGAIFSNNVNSGSVGSAVVSGDIVSAAIDLDNRKAWFRKNGGNWNNGAIGSQNPATNTGGATIASGSFAPAVCFNWVTGDSQTGNFGQSAFSYTPPSGFGNWS